MQVLAVELDRQGMAPYAKVFWAHKDSLMGGTRYNHEERTELEASKKGKNLARDHTGKVSLAGLSSVSLGWGPKWPLSRVARENLKKELG